MTQNNDDLGSGVYDGIPLSRVVKKLSQKGFVEERYDPRSNQRVIRVTNKGHKRINRAMDSNPKTDKALMGLFLQNVMDSMRARPTSEKELAKISKKLLEYQKAVGKERFKGMVINARLEFEHNENDRDIGRGELLYEIYQVSPSSWEEFVKNIDEYWKDGLGAIYFACDFVVLQEIFEEEKEKDMEEMVNDKFSSSKKGRGSESYIY